MNITTQKNRPLVLLFFKIVGIIVLVCFSLITLLSFIVTFAFPCRSNGSSMSPTIKNGVFMLINLNAYRNTEPKRGDIVQVYLDEKKNLIKRIIALPGETIAWKNYDVLINNQKLIESYMFDKFSKAYKQTNEFSLITLKADEYFVMGDNRSYSTDSRHFGPIKKDEITGKIYFVFNLFSR